MRASAEATLQFLGLVPGNSALLCMDLKHIGAKMMVVRALVGGLHLHLVDPSRTPLNEVEGPIEFAAMVPLQALSSVKSLGKVKKLIIGGAPLSREERNSLSKTDTQIFQTFGMTETISHIALSEISDSQNLYHALPGIKIKSTDEGTLVISAERLGVENLITNDLIKMMGPTSFQWLGRKDFIINSGGVKVNPEEIESALAPYITGEFAVSWKEDEQWGQKVMLVLTRGSELKNVESLPLEKYKSPKAMVMVDALPRTENGKLKRLEIPSIIADKMEKPFPKKGY